MYPKAIQLSSDVVEHRLRIAPPFLAIDLRKIPVGFLERLLRFLKRAPRCRGVAGSETRLNKLRRHHAGIQGKVQESVCCSLFARPVNLVRAVSLHEE